VRVIAGLAKGHNLVTPEGINTRPTTDKVKGSLFSMLMGSIAGANVLDLFAGSGALGIEALSRGAEKCVFVDMSDDAVKCVKANLEHTKLSEAAEIRKSDGISFLKGCNEKFDLVFLDPPYHKGLAEEALMLISEKNILKKGGFVSVETDDGELDKAELGTLKCVKNKKYGRISLKIYQNGID